MALTDFAQGTTEVLTLWSRDLWKVARKKSFWEQFTGTDENSPLQRVTEFRKDEKGARAVITLVPDIGGNGVVGDRTLSGNEVNSTAYDQVIEVDQLRNGIKSKGKMTEQKSVVNFRTTARNQLGYWLARTRDEYTTLALSGVPLTKNIDGSNRTFAGGGAGTYDRVDELAWATAIAAPSSKRIVHLGASGAITDGAGTNAAAGTIRKMTYADIVKLKAMARERGIKPISGDGGNECFHLILCPTGMAQLKLDPDFIANVRHAGVRGDKNSLFQGTSNSLMVDGIMIHESFFVYTTRGAAGGAKFGATGADEGQRALMLGAQAMAVGDIGRPEWSEADVDDYGNQPGISVGHIFGLRKTGFKGSWDDPTNVQDFGCLCVDTGL